AAPGLLLPPRNAPYGVAIEMMWVRSPADDPQMNDAAWQAIDEVSIDPAVRRELANNGFRVGVISGDLPAPMARALAKAKPTGDAANEEPPHAVGDSPTASL